MITREQSKLFLQDVKFYRRKQYDYNPNFSNVEPIGKNKRAGHPALFYSSTITPALS